MKPLGTMNSDRVKAQANTMFNQKGELKEELIAVAISVTQQQPGFIRSNADKSRLKRRNG